MLRTKSNDQARDRGIEHGRITSHCTISGCDLGVGLCDRSVDKRVSKQPEEINTIDLILFYS